jgi:hypothetical protein
MGRGQYVYKGSVRGTIWRSSSPQHLRLDLQQLLSDLLSTPPVQTGLLHLYSITRHKDHHKHLQHHPSKPPTMAPSNPLLAIPLALLALMPTIHALGCYTIGLPFNSLHGGQNQEIMGEVFADINTQCQVMDGLVFHKALGHYQLCTEWAITVEPDRTCYEDCTDGCAAVGSGGRGAELASALCTAGCDPGCGGPAVGGTNHINWEFVHDSEEEEITMTYDVCMAALNAEASACSLGSEQTHGGFRYKIDPNEGSC